MLNFDRSIVKHVTQNIQNDFHQRLSGSFSFSAGGVRPGPHWGSLQHSPDALAGLRGLTSKGEVDGRDRGRERGRQRKVTGDRPHPSQIPGSALVDVAVYIALVLVTDCNISGLYFRLLLIFLPNIQDGGQ